METIVVDCSGCKARLKVKLPPGRSGGEVKCPKCGNKTPFGKNGSTPEPAPGPAPAEKPAAAPAPVAPTERPAVTPAPVAPTPPAEKTIVAPIVIPPRVESKPTPSSPPPVAAEETKSEIKKPAVPIILGAGAEQGGASLLAKCPACQWQTKLLQAFAGKKIRCKQCGGIIQVGEEPAAPAAALPAAVPAEPPPVVSPAPAKPQGQGPLPSAQSVTAAAAQAPVPVQPPGLIKLAAAPVQPQPAVPPAPALQASKEEIRALEEQLTHARHRAEEAEKALHDMAGQRAVETVALNRKVTDLERKVAELRSLFTEVVADYKGEIEAAEKRAAVLRQRLARFHS